MMKYLLIFVGIWGLQAALPTIDLVVTQPICEEDGSQVAKVEVYTDGVAHNGLHIAIAISGSAIQGGDYNFKGRTGRVGSLIYKTLDPGKDHVPIVVEAINNNLSDGGRSVVFTLQAPSEDLSGRYMLGASQVASITINDDDYIPPTTPLESQTGLTAVSNSPTAIDLSWSLGDTYDAQQIYYSTNSGETFDEFLLLADTGGTNTTHAHANIIATTNRYYLTASADFDISQPTPIVQVVLGLGIPSPPTSLSASATSHTQIDGTFTDNALNEERHIIEYQIGGGGYLASVTNAPDIEAFTITGLSPADVVDVRAYAQNQAGDSAFSNVDQVTMPSLDLGPATALAVSALSSNSFNATWTLQGTPTNVVLELADNQSFSSATSTNLGVASSHTMVNWPDPSKDAWVRIAQQDGGSTGPWATSTATSPNPKIPSAPTVDLAPLSTTSLLALWTNEGADAYELDWGVVGQGFTSTIGGLTAFTHTIEGLTPATLYQIRVRSINGGTLASSYSSIVQVATFGQGGGGLTGTANGLVVSLQAGTVSGATHYLFQRRDYPLGQWITIGTNTVNTFTDNNYGSKLYIPMYSRPPSTFTDAVLAAGGSKVGTVIFNPASGVGSSAEPIYTTFIDNAHSAGITNVIGYVGTDWGTRSQSVVEDEIDDYYSFYPAIDGIFLDEGGFFNDEGQEIGQGTGFSNKAESLAYYQALAAYVQAKDPNDYVSINNGQFPITFMSGDYVFDGHVPVLIYENSVTRWLDQDQPSHYQDHAPNRFASLISLVDGTVKQVFDHAKKTLHVGNLYVAYTEGPDTNNNAWSELPQSWDEQINRISQLPGNTPLEYRVAARFADGSTSEWSDSISVTTGNDTDPPANIPPTVSITSPSNGSTHTEGDSITISADASDSDGTIASVEFYVGGTRIDTDLTSPYSTSWLATPGSNISIFAVATDNLGAMTQSSTITITVDPLVSNIPPVVTVTSPPSGTTIQAGSNMKIVVEATDADGFIDTVDYFHGTTFMATSTAVSTESEFCLDWSNIGAGTYQVYARATDSGGAQTVSSSITLVVTSVDPPDPPPGFDPQFTIPDDGTWRDLWLNRGALANLSPGTDILIRPGYEENLGSGVTLEWANSDGLPGQPIRIYTTPPRGAKIYAGARGSASSDLHRLIGDYIQFIGIEITQEVFDRTSSSSSSNPTDLGVQNLFDMWCNGSTLAHMYLHDGKTGWSQFTDSNRTGYGNKLAHSVIMNNGWRTPPDDEGVQGYMQTKEPSPEFTLIYDNFWGQGYHASILLQAYAQSGGILNRIEVKGNYFSMKSLQMGGQQPGYEFYVRDNWWVGGNVRHGYRPGERDRDEFSGNIVYTTRTDTTYGHPAGDIISWPTKPALGIHRHTNVEVFNNEVVRLGGAGIVHQIMVIEDSDRASHNFYNNTWSGTKFEYMIDGSEQPGGSYSNYEARFSPTGDVHVAADTSTVNVRVRPSVEWPQSAMIQTINRPSNATITVPGSDLNFLDNGQTYEIYDCYNLEAAPISGTYTGANITLTMTGRTRISPHENNAPVDWDAPPDQRWGAWLIYGR